MGELGEDAVELANNETYPVLLRDAGYTIVSGNRAARRMFIPPENGRWTCHMALYGLGYPPKECYCGHGTSEITVTDVYLPVLKGAFRHIYVPLHEGMKRKGSIDIFKPVPRAVLIGRLPGQEKAGPPACPFVVLKDSGWPGVETPGSNLTRREREVTEHLMLGLSSSEIGRSIGISTNTVNYHMKNIFGKLGVQSRTQATACMYGRKIEESRLAVRETNHRVKNSFAVLSSLVNLRMGDAGAEARETLRWVDAQIRSFFDFHDLLMETGNRPYIGIRRLIDRALSHLRQLHIPPGKDIMIRANIEDVPVSVKSAVPSVKIVTELVTNAIRHAFGGMDSGEIRVEVRQEPPGTCVIIVEDDGVGCPAGLKDRGGSSLGMKIVGSLVSQLGAEHSIDCGGGTRHMITFRTAEE